MLAGKSLWITRPAGQADSLAAALDAGGARVRQLPMLAITPVDINEKIKARVLDLDRYDLLFFISTNAAKLGMALINDYWPQFPVGLEVYAVGPTTAEVLAGYGVRADYPLERMSSEALLALGSLQSIAGKKALIVRGVGGRETLAQALRDRGADVDYLELYRRTCPPYEPGELAGLMGADFPDAVIVTSAEALANLFEVMKADSLSPALLPLFVSSERINGIARDKGFTHTVIMPGADDKAIISSLQDNL